MAAKQRSKKQKDAATADAAAEERKEKSLEYQLDRADVAVQKARDTTQYLQDQWRSHLYRISFLVLLVSFHQCRLPMNECMQNIKVRESTVSSVCICGQAMNKMVFKHLVHSFGFSAACQ